MTEFDNTAIKIAAARGPAAELTQSSPVHDAPSTDLHSSEAVSDAGAKAWTRVQKFLLLEEMRAQGAAPLRLPDDLPPAERARLLAETFVSRDHVKFIGLLEVETWHWPAVAQAYKEQTGRDLDQDVGRELDRQTTVPEEAPPGLFFEKPFLVGPAVGGLRTERGSGPERGGKAITVDFRAMALAEAADAHGEQAAQGVRGGSSPLFVAPAQQRKAAPGRESGVAFLPEELGATAPRAARTLPREDEDAGFIFGRSKP